MAAAATPGLSDRSLGDFSPDGGVGCCTLEGWLRWSDLGPARVVVDAVVKGDNARDMLGLWRLTVFLYAAGSVIYDWFSQERFVLMCVLRRSARPRARAPDWRNGAPRLTHAKPTTDWQLSHSLGLDGDDHLLRHCHRGLDQPHLQMFGASRAERRWSHPAELQWTPDGELVGVGQQICLLYV